MNILNKIRSIKNRIFCGIYDKRSINKELNKYNLKKYFPRFDSSVDREHIRKVIDNTRTQLKKDGYLTGRKSK